MKATNHPSDKMTIKNNNGDLLLEIDAEGVQSIKFKDGNEITGKDISDAVEQVIEGGGGGSAYELLFKGVVTAGVEVNVPAFYPEAADIYLGGTLAELDYYYDSEEDIESYTAYTPAVEVMIYPSTEVEDTLVIMSPEVDIEVEIRVKPKGSTIMLEVLSQSDAYTVVEGINPFNYLPLLANYNLIAHIRRSGSTNWDYYGTVYGGYDAHTSTVYMKTLVDSLINITAWEFDFNNGTITATIGGEE